MPWKVALRLKKNNELVSQDKIRIMCHEKLHLDNQSLLSRNAQGIRIMCHEKLHWDSKRIMNWFLKIKSELCAMKSCTETLNGRCRWLDFLIRIMCHEKLHWDYLSLAIIGQQQYQSYVPWKVALRLYFVTVVYFAITSELCAMKSCTETGIGLRWQIFQCVRVMCHEKLHWDWW